MGEGMQVVKTADLFLYSASSSPPTDSSFILKAARDQVTDDSLTS